MGVTVGNDVDGGGLAAGVGGGVPAGGAGGGAVGVGAGGATVVVGTIGMGVCVRGGGGEVEVSSLAVVLLVRQVIGVQMVATALGS